MMYNTLHNSITNAVHNSFVSEDSKVCKDGYAALLRADTPQKLTSVIFKYWSDLNTTLWPLFQRLLQVHYNEWKEQLNACVFFYNDNASNGYCVVDDNASGVVTIKERTRAVVHGSARIVALDNTTVLLLDNSSAIARGFSTITACHHSRVSAFGRSVIHANDFASVYSDGMTTLYKSPDASFNIHRAYRVI